MTTPKNTLAEWQAREAEVRAKLGDPGIATLAQLKAVSGMEFLQAIWNGELPSAPIGHTLDFIPVEGEPGRIVFHGYAGAATLQPARQRAWRVFLHLARFRGRLRRAVDATQRDRLHHAGTEGQPNPRVDRQDRPGAGRGKVIQVGATVGIAEGRITDAAGKLYAHATTTCLIFPLS